MQKRVLVLGAPPVVEAVRCALPNVVVDEAPAIPDPTVLARADCLLIGTRNEEDAAIWLDRARDLAIVRLVVSGVAPPEDVVFARVENPGEIQLALRAAILDARMHKLLAEFTAWSHDARGAIGVARLALELLGGGDEKSPLGKIENGVVRLGWLVERLPFQVALALDLPLTETRAPSTFGSLDAYVAHLRRIQPRRPIEFPGDEWTASAGSQALVPFVAGLCELTFRLGSASLPLFIAAAPPRRLEVSCECSARPAPWNVQAEFDAPELSRQSEAFVPYRLLEAARLAVRMDIPLRVELTERGFRGSIES